MVLGGIVASVLAVGIAGCQEEELPTSPATPGPSAAPTAQATAASAPNLVAADYVLTAGPETEGFSGSGGVEEDPADAAALAQVAECVGVPGYEPPEPFDEANGDTFVSDEDLMIEVSSRAKILTEDEVALGERIVTYPTFGDCMREMLETSLADAQTDEVSYEIVAVETPEPPRGATALVRVSMGVTDETGETFGFVLDTVYFYVGNVAAQLNLQSVDNAMSPTVEQAMIDQIADKLTNQ
ncbi:hypothetical protein [Frankia nepalensis]|nr:hypothetical protein [Frankia nepalensis]